MSTPKKITVNATEFCRLLEETLCLTLDQPAPTIHMIIALALDLLSALRLSAFFPRDKHISAAVRVVLAFCGLHAKDDLVFFASLCGCAEAELTLWCRLIVDVPACRDLLLAIDYFQPTRQ